MLWLAATALALPPDAPVLVAPLDGAEAQAPTELRVAVTDPDGDELEVRFEGRAVLPAAADFLGVVLPDTQFYACGCNGGSPQTLLDQAAWVAATPPAFVAHVGDIVENGDQVEAEWQVADAGYSLFEDPVLTGLPDGIPYGLAVGNHDQSPAGDPSGTVLYNTYFGEARFLGRPWYAGHAGADNDAHALTFEVGDARYLVVFLEYDPVAPGAQIEWARDLAAANPDRWLIVAHHNLLELDGGWSQQGQEIFSGLRDTPSLFLMVTGHVLGEARRTDLVDDRAVHTMLSDYQGRANGGDGWLRLLEFSPATHALHVRTISPILGAEESDADSRFTVSIDSSPVPWQALGSAEVASGGEASVTWAGLHEGDWAWRVVVDDGSSRTVGPTWGFTVPAPGDTASPPTAEETGAPPPDTGGPPLTPPNVGADPAQGCGCVTSSGPGAAASVVLLLLLPAARARGVARRVS